MSTDYTAYDDGEGAELSTDDRHRLAMTITPSAAHAWTEDGDGAVYYESGRLTEDELVAVAAAILGPLFYFTDDAAALARKFAAEIRRRGFTYEFDGMLRQ